MRKFIIEVTVFMLSILVISAIVQALVDIRIKGKMVRGHDNIDFVKNQDNDLVFLGSSRCWGHFDPHLFEKRLDLKAINIGVEGHSELTMHIIRLKDYLLKNRAPRFAILNFDPFIEAGSFTQNNNFVHKNDFARYAYHCPKEDEPFVNYFRFNFAERTIPLYALLKYKLFFDCLTLTNVSNWAIYGYAKNDISWDTLANPVADARDYLKYYFDTTGSNMARIMDRLDSLNKMCQQAHIKLICVQTPVYQAIYLKPYFAKSGQICHALNIPFFETNSDSLDGNINYFYNANHLNMIGVELMTNNLFSDPDFLGQFLQ
jgi:hypothetical protein